MQFSSNKANFERFARNISPVNATVTITNRGIMLLNKAFVEMLILKAPATGAASTWTMDNGLYAILYRRGLSNEMGMEFTTEPRSPGAFKITFRPAGAAKPSGASIRIQTYLEHHCVDYRQTRRYPVLYEDSEDSNWYKVGPMPCIPSVEDADDAVQP